MTNKTIGSVIKAGITAGKTTLDIIADVKAAFPEAETKAASVNWYRSQMKTQGEKVSKPVKKTLVKAMEDEGEGYSVKAVRDTRGMEGIGFVAKLYKGNRFVAEVCDFGDGSMCHTWTWCDVSATKVPLKLRAFDGKVFERMGTPEEAELEAYVMDLPAVKSTVSDQMIHVTSDWFVSGLVNTMVLTKQLRKLTNKKIAYVTGDGKIFTVNAEPTVQNVNKYVTAENAKLLNGMPEAEALELLKKFQ